MGRKKYDDDDGRTIADMSGIESRSFVSALNGIRSQKKTEENAKAISEETGSQGVGLEEDKKVRRSYTLGAIGAALLIGAVYLVIFLIVILILLLVWRTH